MRQVDCTIRYTLSIPLWEQTTPTNNWKEIDYQIMIKEDETMNGIEGEILACGIA